jgi:uncharacterized protein
VTNTRIATLDIIRGVAVMGILVMNVIGFALPEAAYMNPAASGGHSGADLATWFVDFVFVDGKMRGLFSFLFGASMLLVIERATAKGESAARVHFARMFWLFVLGFAHLALLWWGDILHHYALVGALAWFFRRFAPHELVAAALLLLALEFALVFQVQQGFEANAAAMRGATPTTADAQMHDAYRRSFGVPSRGEIAHDVAVHRSGYAEIVAERWPHARRIPVQTFFFLGMETLAYMLLGMAGLRSGMLTGDWPRGWYRRGAAIGFGIGAPAYALLALIPIRHDFDMASVLAATLVWSEPIRPVMIVGWACLIVLLFRPGSALADRIAAAGRMAFSNYLGTTIVCTTIFYGYGFGLYGQLSRFELTGIVLLVWALILLWSKPWLMRFRYGPAEWLWRSLARGRLQPMRGGAIAIRSQ